MKEFNELVVFNGGVEFSIPPSVLVDKLELVATPHLTNAELYLLDFQFPSVDSPLELSISPTDLGEGYTFTRASTATYTSEDPLTITYFLDGFEGRTIKLLGDGKTVIAHDTMLINTNTRTDKVLELRKVYRFTLYNGIWYEDA